MTVTLQLAETIVDAVEVKLTTGLAARVAAINTEFADSITLTAPAEFRVGSWGSIAPVQPAVLITEMGTGAEQKFGEEGAHSFIYKTELMVAVFELDPDQGRLARKLWRQARAIVECLWDDPPAEMLGTTAPFPAFKIHPVRTTPGPVFEPNAESQWTSVYGIVFQCDQHNGS